MVGVWQQDRWSNGGARGLVAGVTTQRWGQLDDREHQDVALLRRHRGERWRLPAGYGSVGHLRPQRDRVPAEPVLQRRRDPPITTLTSTTRCWPPGRRTVASPGAIRSPVIRGTAPTLVNGKNRSPPTRRTRTTSTPSGIASSSRGATCERGRVVPPASRAGLVLPPPTAASLWEPARASTTRAEQPDDRQPDRRAARTGRWSTSSPSSTTRTRRSSPAQLDPRPLHRQGRHLVARSTWAGSARSRSPTRDRCPVRTTGMSIIPDIAVSQPDATGRPPVRGVAGRALQRQRRGTTPIAFSPCPRRWLHLVRPDQGQQDADRDPVGNQQAFTPSVDVRPMARSRSPTRLPQQHGGAPCRPTTSSSTATRPRRVMQIRRTGLTALTDTSFDMRQAPEAGGFFTGDYERAGERGERVHSLLLATARLIRPASSSGAAERSSL